MQNSKDKNMIDLSLLTEDFFLEVLNLITQTKEGQNELLKK